MKIIMAIHHYPPTYVGGAELVTRNAARALATRGHHVEVLCIEEPFGPPGQVGAVSTEEDGVLVHRLRADVRAGDLPLGMRYRHPDIDAWFADRLRLARPDIVHVQSAYLLGAGVLEVALDAGIPTVASLHDFWYVCPRTTLLRSDGQICPTPGIADACALCTRKERRRYKLADRLTLGLAGQTLRHVWRVRGDGLVTEHARRNAYVRSQLERAGAILVLSRFLDRIVQDAGVRPRRVVLRRQGVNPNLRPVLPHPKVWNGPLRIGYIGQIAPHKGVDVLVRAFLRLQALAPQAGVLRIYGDVARAPRYSAELGRLIGRRHDITLCGPFDPRELARIHGSLDLLVVPSVWYENSPTVILEAFACGTPVVASRLGGMAELVGADGGYLFRPGDAADLARVLGDVIADRSKLAELSQRLPRVDTVDDEVADLERLYAELTGLDLTLPTGHASPGSRVVRGVESA